MRSLYFMELAKRDVVLYGISKEGCETAWLLLK
jgi:hypothetical protein